MVNANISDSISSEIGRRIQPTYGYYRQPNKWITVSPTTRMEKVRYIEDGWEYLGEYGAFDMSPYVANHPFETLFMFGGAKEMPVDQLLETGLYLDAPLVPTCRLSLTQFHQSHEQACWNRAVKVEFPQMEGVAEALIGPFPCEFCERKLSTVEGREQHQTVAHKERMGDMQTGKSLGTSLAEALSNVGRTNTEEEQAERIRELEAKLAQPETIQSETNCECGGTFKRQGKFFHERGQLHKDWVAKQ